MAETTGISWTDATFNPWRGCTKVSPGCDNCYAEKLSARNPALLGEWGDEGKRAMAAEKYWNDPIRWNREAEKAGVYKKVFCASLADVFEDRPELVAPRLRLFDLIARTPNLIWQLLTKRPYDIRRLILECAELSRTDPKYAHNYGWLMRWARNIEPPENVWLGTSVEDQSVAHRITQLAEVSAAVYWVSVEPLIELVTLEVPAFPPGHRPYLIDLVHWVVIGGESGSRAREMRPEWATRLINECRNTKTSHFYRQRAVAFFKQTGSVLSRKWIQSCDESVRGEEGRSMKRKSIIKAVDLFCGAGGTSTGLRAACNALGKDLQLLAINHWDVAIATHSENHPDTKHICSTIEAVDPRKVIPSGHLDLMVASPECTYYSKARGGKPIHDQARSSPWRIVEWASQIRIDTILIENIPELQGWGPLNAKTGKPIKRLNGTIYHAFLGALRSLGYKVEARVLNAANYGDATARLRLFIQCQLGRRPIVWPAPTHAEMGANLFEDRKPWRAVREIIDWSIPSHSIFDRKTPLKPKTLARIAAGLKRFGGIDFIVPQLSGGRPRTLDEPLPTITTTSTGIGLCQPFIVVLRNNCDAASIDSPVSTITAGGIHHGICEPFLVKYNGTGGARSIDEPLDTITARDRFGLVQTNEGEARLDIRYRMLRSHELAAAMSFPRDYKFHGKHKDRIRQIGNAVPVQTARALCEALLAA